MFGKTGRGLLCTSVWVLLLLALGCSDGVAPLGPESDGVADGRNLPGDRNLTEFLSTLLASEHDDYVTISSTVGGLAGGTVSGTVSGYQDAFSITVPEEAFTGSRTLKIMVPTDHVPVYQLLPHGEFVEEVTVTLDYKLWLDNGTFEVGDSCEVYFMNEETEEFDRLSPPAVFVASATASTVTFKTDHFSRWGLGSNSKD